MHYRNEKEGPDTQEEDSSVGLNHGNIPESSSCRAFREAVRDLHNMDDFEKERIGGGFFGEVYKVTHKRTGQVMVLKINKSADNRSRSLREIQILNKLEHPHILRYVGACVHEGQLHPLTEYVNGGNLEDLLQDKEQEVSWQRKIKLAKDIAAGMAFLHSKKIYHRDIASKNCLLRKDESGYTAVVADFGLAGEVPGEFSIDQPAVIDGELRDEEDSSGAEEGHREPCFRTIRRASLQDGRKEVKCEIVQSPSPIRRERKQRKYSMRKVQSVVGSPYWMAPEVMKSKPYNELVDVFSYGILLCEIIARIDADPDYLQRTSEFGLDQEAFKETCRSRALQCPEWFMEIAFECCQVDPDKRPKFPDVVDRLEKLLAEYPESPKLQQKSRHEDSTDGAPERKSSYTTQLEIRLLNPNCDTNSTESVDARCGSMGSELKIVPESTQLDAVDGVTKHRTSLRIEQRGRRSLTTDGSCASLRRMSSTSKLQPIDEQKRTPEEHSSRSPLFA